MNRPAIEKLIQQYRTDPSIIFQMPAVIRETPCGSALCIGGQVCVNQGWKLKEMGTYNARAIKEDQNVDALSLAEAILGISEMEGDRLFLRAAWPVQFDDLADTPHLAADRLQHFLNTDGKE